MTIDSFLFFGGKKLWVRKIASGRNDNVKHMPRFSWNLFDSKHFSGLRRRHIGDELSSSWTPRLSSKVRAKVYALLALPRAYDQGVLCCRYMELLVSLWGCWARPRPSGVWLDEGAWLVLASVMGCGTPLSAPSSPVLFLPLSEWDVETGKCLKTFKHKDPILAIKINDTYIVSSCERGVVKVWHAVTAQPIKVRRW